MFEKLEIESFQLANISKLVAREIIVDRGFLVLRKRPIILLINHVKDLQIICLKLEDQRNLIIITVEDQKYKFVMSFLEFIILMNFLT